MSSKLLNFIIFQLGWVITVYYHNIRAALFGMLLVIINFIIAKSFSSRSVTAAIFVAIMGIVNDYILLVLGLIAFPGQTFTILPLWLIALWFLFVSTFQSSLNWINNCSVITQAILGGFGGAISYTVGTNLGAMQYNYSGLSQLTLHFLNWFILFPILIWIHNLILNAKK